MNFFLETGVYVLIVALAAAVTGFVAFKLFMSVRGSLKLGRSHKSAAAVSKRANDEMDDLDQSATSSAPSPAPVSQQAQSGPQVEATAAGPEVATASKAGRPVETPQPEVSMPTHTPEGVARDGELGEHDRRAKTQDDKSHGDGSSEARPGDEPTVGLEAPVEETPASEGETLIADETPLAEDTTSDDGPIKSVAAPPEERDGEDAFMAMFGTDESDESSAGDLAAELEDAEISALLQDARSLARVLKGEGDSHA